MNYFQNLAPKPIWPNLISADGRRRPLEIQCSGLHCTLLHCAALCSTVLHCTALCCTVLHCAALLFTVLYFTMLYSTALHCTARCLIRPRTICLQKDLRLFVFTKK